MRTTKMLGRTDTEYPDTVEIEWVEFSLGGS